MAGAPDVGEVLRGSGPVLVYRAALGEPVVVKRLAGTGDIIAVRRFERERRFARLLRHPALPRLVAEGKDWIAFEALEVGLPEAQRHSSAAVRAILAPLADALAFIHARGIVHRDIKPAHVLFRGEAPVLIDFGIAGTPDDDLQQAELSGSPAWMAPEQLLGGPVGSAADIWSFSALGLFLLTGEKPYAGEADTVLRLRRAGEPPAVRAYAALERNDTALAGLLEAGLGPAAGRPAAADFSRLLAVRR
ncbi:protein kinase [Shinella sp. CPCC 101442]|uniref:protein kinase domain-containing protein n=1 Tax=Shinella sp. CPCC 101442 TaxID=2932265 RepID=UPI0021537AEA|nr:protein kinase [Shinella sp. CPCC 101442]MCR6502744.1 protein kinase [Shinella sp. CPCC 101442]